MRVASYLWYLASFFAFLSATIWLYVGTTYLAIIWYVVAAMYAGSGFIFGRIKS